jgi:hypothetical protein
MQRWCLQDWATELTVKRGYDVIIDFASGLPTNDHIHQVIPDGTIVIYSDYDPVVVEYAHQILADAPENIYYFQADVRQPETLLNRPDVQEILGGRRKVAFGFWGVSLFLKAEDVAHAMRTLYDWAAPGSCCAFNAQGAVEPPTDPAALQMMKIYERMGSPQHYRPLETYKELIQPWKIDEPGFISLLDWHGFDQSVMTEEDRRIFGPESGSYGAYLVK